MSGIQLTPLWEYVLRTRQLPETISEQRLFMEFCERLRDPEWQVRQHALRVLIDVLVVMSAKADPYMAQVFPQLIENLAHQTPTLRKSALDCLRVYLCESDSKDRIIFDILNRLRTKSKHYASSSSSTLMNERLKCGLLLSLPALMQCLLNSKKCLFLIRHTMNLLIERMGQSELQEITLKVLRKMHELLGETDFMAYMSHGLYREYELLCNVYGLEPIIHRDHDAVNYAVGSSSDNNDKEPLNTWRLMANKSQQAEINSKGKTQSQLNQLRAMSSTSSMEEFSNGNDNGNGNYPLAKIIMETEIKLNNDTLTMRILEANRLHDDGNGNGNRNGSGNGTCTTSVNSSCMSKCLEGAEGQMNNNEKLLKSKRLDSAKKLSDTMGVIRLLSDSDDLTNSTQTLSENVDNEPNSIENDKASKATVKESYTPSLLTPPRTPKRVTFGGEIVKMRTPDSDANNITNNSINQHQNQHQQQQCNNNQSSREMAPSSNRARPHHLPLSHTTSASNTVTVSGSTAHNQPILTIDLSKISCLSLEIPNDNTKPLTYHPIRMLNNQSPRIKKSPLESSLNKHNNANLNPSKRDEKDDAKEKNDSVMHYGGNSPSRSHYKNRLSPQDNLISPRPEHKEIEVLHNLQRDPSPIHRNALSANRKSSAKSNEREERNRTILSSIEAVTKDVPPKSWEDLHIIDDNALWDLRSANWRQRLHGITQLEDALHSSENLALIQPCLESLLRPLLSAEYHPEVADVKRRLLNNLITRLPLENLENRIQQILNGLCRQGGPSANRVCKVLMHRLPPGTIVSKLISIDFLHNKSSRFREHALQMVIYALMTFPSTSFDMTTCIRNATNAALNRKRRVRQAALDVLAVLGQITGVRQVLDCVQQIINSRDDRGGSASASGSRSDDDGAALLAAVKTRLSRKQLPLITTDGAIEYSLHIPPKQLTTINSYQQQQQQQQHQQQHSVASYNHKLYDVNDMEHNGQHGPDIDWIITGIGSVSPISIRKRAQRHYNTYYQYPLANLPQEQASNSDSNSNLNTNSGSNPHSQRFSSIRGQIKNQSSTDDNQNFPLQHMTSYNYGLPCKKSNDNNNGTHSITQRSLVKLCSETSSMDGRSSDSTYTSSGGSNGNNTIVTNHRKSNDCAITDDSEEPDCIAGRFTRQPMNSRFPTMTDHHNYLRVYKQPNYYPGMGAYAYLQQQQLNINTKYPKIYYNFNTQQQQQQAQDQKPKKRLMGQSHLQHSSVNSYNNKLQHFNRYTNQKQQQQQQQQHEQQQQQQQKSCRNCEEDARTSGTATLVSKHNQGHNSHSNSHKVNEAVNDTDTDAFTKYREPIKATAVPATATIPTDRRSLQVEPISMQSNKSSQTGEGVVKGNQSKEAATDNDERMRDQEVIKEQELRESSSIRSATYSQKSTASARSSEGAHKDQQQQQEEQRKVENEYKRDLNNKSLEETYQTKMPVATAAEEGGSIEDISSQQHSIINDDLVAVGTPQTTCEVMLNGQPDIHELTNGTIPTTIASTPLQKSVQAETQSTNDIDQKESNEIVTSPPSIIDEVAETLVDDILIPNQTPIPKARQQLQRTGSFISLESKTDSIQTQFEEIHNSNTNVNTPSLPSGTQSIKSLSIEEFIEVAHEEEISKRAFKTSIKEPIEIKFDEIPTNKVGAGYEGQMTSDENSSRPSTCRGNRSPTIEELKTLSRRNSIIKSLDSLYDKPQISSPLPKHETYENLSELSSQSSTQMNSSSINTTMVLPTTPFQLMPSTTVKPQRNTLNQKSNNTNFLKRHRRVSPVKQSIKMTQAEFYPTTMQKFDKPRESILKAFDQLDSNNWETIIVGLKNMVRLIRYHSETLDSQMHMVCIQLTRSVRNLRSQVARAACQASTELFSSPIKTRPLEVECDDLVCALLHRTADTNRFLRSDATRALESMCDYLTPGKILNLLNTKGAQHQNALVRTTTAKLLYRLVERLGSEKIYCLPRDQRDKFFITGANLLLEGSLDTRSYAKSLFKLLSQHHSYARMLIEIIPPRTYRNIEKSLKNIR